MSCLLSWVAVPPSWASSITFFCSARDHLRSLSTLYTWFSRGAITESIRCFSSTTCRRVGSEGWDLGTAFLFPLFESSTSQTVFTSSPKLCTAKMKFKKEMESSPRQGVSPSGCVGPTDVSLCWVEYPCEGAPLGAAVPLGHTSTLFVPLQTSCGRTPGGWR